jgi:hypothetical protein
VVEELRNTLPYPPEGSPSPDDETRA